MRVPLGSGCCPLFGGALGLMHWGGWPSIVCEGRVAAGCDSGLLGLTRVAGRLHECFWITDGKRLQIGRRAEKGGVQ